ncbi:hypothetical protein MJO28_005458 [Puccinia striiformis f. sp. tritici]|uniref:Uncharacterized protein n=1 Tax=Puccinia striiformis f. sp. tritici TaxID=168172 RepID=A0ACC0EKS8_9BASI|nr:hypothetical protein MJO28_005458 [Puccinia striiformis f. sp. tritici]
MLFIYRSGKPLHKHTWISNPCGGYPSHIWNDVNYRGQHRPHRLEALLSWTARFTKAPLSRSVTRTNPEATSYLKAQNPEIGCLRSHIRRTWAILGNGNMTEALNCGRKIPFSLGIDGTKMLKGLKRDQARRITTKAIAHLTKLLVGGPASIFSWPTDQKYFTQWKAYMIIEYGAIVIENTSFTGQEHMEQGESSTKWAHTRLWILEKLNQMGFGNSTEQIDWKHVLETYKNEVTMEHLASCLLSDINLVIEPIKP